MEAPVDMILGGLCIVLLLGQCNSSDKNESFGITLVVVAALSEALARLTKARCERVNRIFCLPIYSF